MKKYLWFLLMLSFLACTPASEPASATFSLPLAELAGQGAALTAQGEGLIFAPPQAGESFTLLEGEATRNLGDFTYLVAEVYHENPFSAILFLDFFEKNGGKGISTQCKETAAVPTASPGLYMNVGILPYVKTQVIFPLSHLDGQEIFIPRYYRQLKGGTRGERIHPDSLQAVKVRLEPFQSPAYEAQVEIHRVYLTTELPEKYEEPVAVADSMGQWMARDWPGKTPSVAAMVERLQGQRETYAAGIDLPERSVFGGWTERQYEATGFFRLEHDGKRWWLVDPYGYPFLSAGLDCVRPGISFISTNREELFTYLPPKTTPGYEDIVSYDAGRQQTNVNFYVHNLVRAFGTDWREPWTAITKGIMQKAGFNTVANWSDLPFAQASRLPYVIPLQDFPRTEQRLYRDFPDVFDPAYRDSARRFAQQLEAFKDDPYLIGYFLRNEPHWAFGAHNLALEMFKTDQPSHTKTACIEWLEARYEGDLPAFQQAWGMDLAAFAELENVVLGKETGVIFDDLYAFSKVMVRRYVSEVVAEVKKVDPHHLNLGIRYAWVSSDLLYEAGESFDVFSINGYNYPGPPETAEIYRRTGKPVMIGEFHFGATDRGLPATGIQGAANQADRGRAFRYYVEQGFARPEVIGLHYFTLLDQGIIGRFDGENYQIGFLDVCNRPYPEMMDAAQATHKRMYDVATGALPPYDTVIPKVPQIYY
jgi:hypothetical protein